MGMSASQIRYCMLQARKNDIEYQGQQINQQRTTLATQSAAHNTELLTLTVPTPPSTDQYTTTTYNYTMNGNDCTIKGLNFDKTTGTYKISYTTTVIEDTATRGSKFNVLYSTSTVDDKTVYTPEFVVLNSTKYALSAADAQSVEHKSNIEIIKNDCKDVAADEEFYYAELKDGTNQYAYFSNTELQEAMSQSGQLHQAQDYVVSPQKKAKDGVMEGATINWSSTGRMVSFTTSNKQTISLDVDTVADDAAYENAYNEYLYQKDQYNKKMDEINAKLSIIQSQDKELELQLRNLDTQQQAISTEMDAVKSVTDKNIEKSFNIFG